ncbi:FABP family protein, partial [Mycolicibacterium smegmatis]
LARSYRSENGLDVFQGEMRAVGQPLQDHLAAVLHRQR